MPPELAPYLSEIVTAIVALVVGWLFTRLAASSKISAIGERLKAEERRSAEIEARLAQTAAEAQSSEQDAQTFRNQLTELRSRLEAELKAAAEKQALLERAEANLSDTFKALSADALRVSSEQFLQLAKSSLATQTEEAKGEIEKRKIAIENFVKPVAESLGKFELRIGEIEKAREGAYAELKEQVRALGDYAAWSNSLACRSIAISKRSTRRPRMKGNVSGRTLSLDCPPESRLSSILRRQWMDISTRLRPPTKRGAKKHCNVTLGRCARIFNSFHLRITLRSLLMHRSSPCSSYPANHSFQPLC